MSTPLPKDQIQLGGALSRARARAAEEVALSIRELGERLARQFYGLLRLIQTHALDNNAFEKPLEECSLSIELLTELLGAVHLSCVEGQVYVNDVRIRLDEAAGVGTHLGSLLAHHGVGGVSFHMAPQVEQMRLLIHCFASTPAQRAPRLALQRTLMHLGMSEVELFGLMHFRIRDSSDERERDPAQVRAQCRAVMHDTWNALVNRRLPNPLPARRAVTELLELGPDDPLVWPLDPGDADPFADHALRVCLMSLLIGRGLGLTEEGLQDLGVAALLHDVGYATGLRAQADGGEGIGFAQADPSRSGHVSAGARLLVRQRGFHEAKILRALAILEHHQDFNNPSGRPTVFARILRIADDYDNLVRAGGAGQSPHTALQTLQAHAGTRYDPVLLQIAVNAMGRYPPGTIMALFDGRVVQSISVTRLPSTFETPLCRVLRGTDGTWADFEVIMDLQDAVPEAVVAVYGPGEEIPEL